MNASGGRNNCVPCAIEVDNVVVKGRKTSGATSDEFANPNMGVNELTDLYGSPRSYDKFWQITENIPNNGTYIVATRVPGMDGHAFNVVNDSGTVRIFDGQLGEEITRDQLSGYLQEALRNNPKSTFSVWNTTNK